MSCAFNFDHLRLRDELVQHFSRFERYHSVFVSVHDEGGDADGRNATREVEFGERLHLTEESLERPVVAQQVRNELFEHVRVLIHPGLGQVVVLDVDGELTGTQSFARRVRHQIEAGEQSRT